MFWIIPAALQFRAVYEAERERAQQLLDAGVYNGPRLGRALDALDYGNAIRNGQLSFNGTAALAKHRLRMVIAKDREAVPAYRWVRHSPWRCIFDVLRMNSKPRYRLERRQ